jgi:ankyrin repeat protein
MSRALPERPSLDQLRRRAKELRDAVRAGEPSALNRFASHLAVPTSGEAVTLAAAQVVIAREHGFASWPRLKAAVDAKVAPDLGELVDDFLVASTTGKDKRAARLLAADRRIATYDISTAAVLGDLATMQELLADDPGAAVRPDDRRNWPPLLYACHSRWHRIDPSRAESLLQLVWLLLDTGASANSNNGLPSREGYRSALYGAAGIADNPAVTSLLLRHGANPDDDESLYHAAQHPDLACLRVLLGHGARVDGTNAFAAAITPGNAVGVRLMIESGGDPGRPVRQGSAPDGHLADMCVNPLPMAVAECGVDVVDLLLAAGADPDAPGLDHRSSIRRAVRRGNLEVARLLRKYGAHDDTTEVDHFLGACLRGDQASVQQLQSVSPGLFRRLTRPDLALLVEAAEHAEPAAVRLMLDVGFPIESRLKKGGTALHAAAYAGRPDMIALLLSRGADMDARDGAWEATPVAWASVGSGEPPRFRHDADWISAINVLVAAGASTEGAWVPGKPPSEEVAALLTSLGVYEPGTEED